MVKFLTVASAICLIANISIGEGVATPVEPKMPTVKMNEKNELEIIYDLNKVAVISMRENTQEDLSYKINLRTSSCQTNVPVIDCTMSAWIKFYEILPVWKIHPDPTRIGQIMKVDHFNVGSVPTLIVTGMKYQKDAVPRIAPLFHEVLKRAKNETIRCSDYKWLPNDVGIIDEVSYELIQASPETGLDENRSAISFRSVQLERDLNGIVFSNIKPYFLSSASDFFTRIVPSYAPLMGWSFQTNNKSCDYSFEREVNQEKFGKIIKDSMTPFKPFPISDISSFQRKLTQFNDEYSKDDVTEFNMYIKNLPPDIRILLFYNLAATAFTQAIDGQGPKFVVKAKESQ